MNVVDAIHPVRRSKGALAAQIYEDMRASIMEGRLAPGARLPSWNDLAAQLGVSRGTVRAAYERLVDARLIVASGAAGTRVAPWGGLTPRKPFSLLDAEVRGEYRTGVTPPLPFQMGVPSQALFPKAVWARLLAAASRQMLAYPTSSPDPRGEGGLRSEIAAYLAFSRGVNCEPSQVFITNGFAGALGIACRALRLVGARVLTEDPGYVFARTALSCAGAVPVPVPVDRWGMQVEAGIAVAPDACAALVTPGQQAPLGMAMSVARRHTLLDWAASDEKWIIEDDYLGELQLERHAAPALAAVAGDRVVHIGTFSKTLSPMLRLGYMVVPPSLISAVSKIVGSVDPAPAPLCQIAAEAFLRQGHHMRHLRRLKRAYREQRSLLVDALQRRGLEVDTAGLSVVIEMPCGVHDDAVARAAAGEGLAPMPLSPWYVNDALRRHGLLLGVTNIDHRHVEQQVEQLVALIRRDDRSPGRVA